MNWSQNAVSQPVAALTVDVFVFASVTEPGVQALVSQWSPGDTGGEASTFSLRYSAGGREGAPSGPCFLIHTDDGVFEARSSIMPPPGWHHLAGIYDGGKVTLLVDGQVVARSAATGRVKPCEAPVVLGCLESGIGRFEGSIKHARVVHAVVAEREMGMVAYDAHLGIPNGLELRLQPDTFFVQDGRQELKGQIAVLADERCAARLKSATDPTIELTVRRPGKSAALWSTTLPLASVGTASAYPFALPMRRLKGGYYELSLRVLDQGTPLQGVATGRTDRRRGVFVKLKTRRAAASSAHGHPDRYLAFVRETMEKLATHQSARLGGTPHGTLFLTGDGRHQRGGWRSLGRKVDGRFHTVRSYETPFELEPTRCDFELWPILDELSRLSGNVKYARLVDEMATAVAHTGFDPRSGLLYFSEESDFDVVDRKPRGLGDQQVPRFKPLNTGNCPELPLERLWRHAPRQMARCARSMFWGLVTDPGRMDFNRFTFFGYDDESRTPAMTATPSQLGFDTAASRIIHWWAAAYGRTGDTDCLEWARRMTDKWQAVQHPETGLVPNFFGDGEWNPGAEQQPAAWAEVRNATLTAVAWMDAVDELSRRPGAEDLAAQLAEMAGRLALGVARYAYDPTRKIFLEHLHLDGRPYVESARYAFHTQAEKDEAVRVDPEMEEVAVFTGAGWYQPAPFWEHSAGTAIPWHLALVAERNGDRELIDRLARMAEDAVQAASELRGPFTSEARWTFRATGLNVKLLVSLHRMSGERRYLDHARSLADAELDRLPTVVYPEWWRLRERAVLLDALLRLYEAVA